MAFLMTELWDEIEYLIKTINSGEAGQYDKGFMKVKLNADGNLGLGSIPKLHILTAIVRSVSEEDSKYYPQVLLGECLYELQKCCSMIELIFSEEIGINETCASKECMIFHYIIGCLKTLVINLNPTFVMAVMKNNGGL